MARTLGYGKEHDQASLEEAWRCLKSERVVPDAVTLGGFLSANFFITLQQMDNSIMQDVLGNLQQSPGSDVKHGEIPCSFEVLDEIDALRHYESLIELQDAMQSLWAGERSARPSLTTKQKKRLQITFRENKGSSERVLTTGKYIGNHSTG